MKHRLLPITSLTLAGAFLTLVTNAFATSTCGGPVWINPSFIGKNPANAICQAASGQAGQALTFSTLGEAYNNLTSGTTAAICDLPGLRADTAVSEVGVTLWKGSNLDTNPPSTCTLRVYSEDLGVVFSDGPVSTPCNHTLLVTGLGGQKYFGNVRCTFNAKNASGVAAMMDSITEVHYN